MDSFLYEHPRPGHTTLPGSAEIAGDNAIHRTFRIRVVKHYDRGFPAQLQRNQGIVATGIFDHPRSRLRSAGEGYLGHIGVAGQGPATGFAIAGNDIDHPRWETRLIDNFCELEHRSGRIFGSLQNYRITCRQRRTEFGCSQKHLCIPRYHGSDHTDRFTRSKNMHIGLVNRQRGAFNLVGHASEIVIIVTDIPCLTSCFLEQFAAVPGFNITEMIRLVRNQVTQPVQDSPAGSRCHV